MVEEGMRGLNRKAEFSSDWETKATQINCEISREGELEPFSTTNCSLIWAPSLNTGEDASFAPNCTKLYIITP